MTGSVSGWQQVQYEQMDDMGVFLQEGEGSEQTRARFSGQIHQQTGMLFPAAPGFIWERIRGVVLGAVALTYGSGAAIGNVYKASDRTISSLLPHEKSIGLATSGVLALWTLYGQYFDGMSLLKTPIMVVSCTYIVNSLVRIIYNKDEYSVSFNPTSSKPNPKPSPLAERITVGAVHLTNAARVFCCGVSMLVAGVYSVFAPKDSLIHFRKIEEMQKSGKTSLLTWNSIWKENSPKTTLSELMGNATISLTSIFSMQYVGNENDLVPSVVVDGKGKVRTQQERWPRFVILSRSK